MKTTTNENTPPPRKLTPCAHGDNRPIMPTRSGDNVCLPEGYKNRIWVEQDGGKLDRLQVADFGLGYGKTCQWKTGWCRERCYAKYSYYDVRHARAEKVAEKEALARGLSPAAAEREAKKGSPSDASLTLYRRLTWVETVPTPEMWYRSIAGMDEHAKIRIARSGDVGDPRITEAICKALVRRPDILFMWPTRSWTGSQGRGPRQSWDIMQKYLPKKILCSYDTDLVGLLPPSPATYVIETREEMERSKKNLHLGQVAVCPHYVDWRPCIECLLCFTTSSPKARPPRSVAFGLHGGCKGSVKWNEEKTPSQKEWREEILRQGGRAPGGKLTKATKAWMEPSPSFDGLEALDALEASYSPEKSGYDFDDMLTFDSCWPMGDDA